MKTPSDLAALFRRPRRPTVPDNARIWVWENDGPVKLTLKSGQTLQWYHSQRTDEGWSSCHRVWGWDGTELSERTNTDGRDCDGRLSSNSVHFTTPDRFKARAPLRDESGQVFADCEEQAAALDALGVRWPEWTERSSRQRDYSAESMNY